MQIKRLLLFFTILCLCSPIYCDSIGIIKASNEYDIKLEELLGYKEGDLSIRTISIEADKLPIVLQGDKRVLEYLMISNKVDSLFITNSIIVDNLIRLQLYYVNLEDLDLVLLHHSLFPRSNSQGLEVRLLLSLKDVLFGPDTSLVELKESMALGKVYVDDEEKAVKNNIFFTTKDYHAIVLECLGYETKTYEVDLKDDYCLLDNTLDPVLPQKVLISTPMHFAKLQIGSIEATSPFILNDYSFPLSVIATEEGFLDTSFQSSKGIRSLSLNLSPSLLSGKEFYEKNRDSFYSGFAISLGLFAVKVLFTSLSSIEPDIFVPLATFSDALTIVSLGSLVYKLYWYWFTGYSSVV